MDKSKMAIFLWPTVYKCMDMWICNYIVFDADDPDSKVVNAYWEDDDTLSATIQTANDVYAVEVCTAVFTYLLFYCAHV